MGPGWGSTVSPEPGLQWPRLTMSDSSVWVREALTDWFFRELFSRLTVREALDELSDSGNPLPGGTRTHGVARVREALTNDNVQVFEVREALNERCVQIFAVREALGE